MRALKEKKVPENDVKAAITELKVRKKKLEDTVGSKLYIPIEFVQRYTNVLLISLNFKLVRNLITRQCLSQDLDFFKKKELLKFFRELFAKERSYPSTAKIGECISNARIICPNMSQ